jgi:hypothetical protein
MNKEGFGGPQQVIFLALQTPAIPGVATQG